jgi:hypothetical protein
MPGVSLFVAEHAETAKSIDAAGDPSITQVAGRATPRGASDFAVKAVPVHKAIGLEFARDPNKADSFCMFRAKTIASVGRQGDNWRVVVRNRWDQEIILDSKFDLVHASPAIGKVIAFHKNEKPEASYRPFKHSAISFSLTDPSRITFQNGSAMSTVVAPAPLHVPPSRTRSTQPSMVPNT